MITIKDIDDCFSKKSIEDLHNDYKIRQLSNILTNETFAKVVLDELSTDNYLFPEVKTTSKLNLLIATLRNKYSEEELKYLYRILFHYNYNSSQDIITILQNIDFYTNGEINYNIFSLLIKALISINNIKDLDNNEFLINTKYGQFKTSDASKELGLEINPKDRRGLCHSITTEFLISNPTFLGAYYYIPLPFSGFLEHSVIINPMYTTIYDLANNRTVPISIWNELYNASFVIEGKKLVQLSLATEEKYGISLNIAEIEEIRRTRKK